jgi:hypothetical protein
MRWMRVGGWDLSVVAPYRPEPRPRRDRSSQTGDPNLFHNCDELARHLRRQLT